MKQKLFTTVLALILSTSCATSPGTIPASPAQPSARLPVAAAPEWTTRTTFLEGSNLVFVLAGPENAVVPDLALQAMTRYLDLPVTQATPVASADAVQKFLKKMSSTTPSDRYLSNGKGWWKVVLSKGEWESNRTRLKALFEAVTPDPSVELERTADDLVRQGKYFDAVTGYVAAASASVGEGHPAFPERFRATLAKAQDVLSRFTLASTTPAQSTRVGQPFATTFDVKLTYGTGAEAPTIAGAVLRFSYKTKVNGRLAVTGQSVKTDPEGLVRFALPIPDFAAQDSLVVLVDVNPWLEALAGVPKEFRDPVANFENLTAERKLLLPFAVESASKLVPMIVALADFDEKGGLERRQESTAALIAALQKSGFQTSGIQVNLSLLKSPNDNVILTAWKFQGKTSGRAVYGTVALVSVAADGSQFKAEVAGTVKVVDLTTSKPVYQMKTTKVASAGDRASSITQGFRQWAVDAAAAMESELP